MKQHLQNLSIRLACLMILLSSAQLSLGQLSLNTKSGQELIILDDGNYSLKLPEVDESDESFMGAEIDPLEDPNVDAPLDRNESRTILNLIEELKQIEARSTVDQYYLKQDIDLTKRRLKHIKNEKGSQADVDQLQGYLDRYEVDYDLAKLRSETSYDLIKKSNDVINKKPNDRPSFINMVVESAAVKLGTSTNPLTIVKTDYNFKVDNKNPENTFHGRDCNLSFNGIDQSIDKKRIDHAPEHLFGFTSNKVKHFFKEKNFLNCNAYLSKVDGKYYLNLDLDLASKDGAKTYGQINKGDMIKLTFINGDNFIANSVFKTVGQLEAYSGHTVYRAAYRIEDIELELIEERELDKIGVIWSTGFEEYPIYEVDLLMRQIECIKKAD